MTREVVVHLYDESWPILFQQEAQIIKEVLKDEIVAMHHIGSTSIPGCYSKPIIDILLEVKDIEMIDSYNNKMI